jgi:hypothetical protein
VTEFTLDHTSTPTGAIGHDLVVTDHLPLAAADTPTSVAGAMVLLRTGPARPHVPRSSV